MQDIIKKKKNSEEIRKTRAQVLQLFYNGSENISSSTIEIISPRDLELLLDLYDRLFFHHWFKTNFKGKLKFSLSTRMTRSAGLTFCPKNIDKLKSEELVLEIRIGVDFFFRYADIAGNKKVGGIGTNNSVDALLLVFEHELCHVIEYLLYHKSSCRGSHFKEIASNLFGHTESYHSLPTHRQIASERLGYKLGDTVSFTSAGNKLTGALYKINKRATVMVKDKNGSFVDSEGVKFAKYYVPLSLLE